MVAAEIPLCEVEDARAIAWSDAVMDSISWSDDESSLLIELTLGSVNARFGTDRVTLRGDYAHSLDLDIRWLSAGGMPRGGRAMTWDVEFSRDAGEWIVVLDFAGEGTIRFRCTQLFVRLQKPGAAVSSPGLLQWNLAVLDLNRVLLGVISPNMRAVVLRRERDQWIFLFVLERDDATDREEIEDVPSEFEALQSSPVPCSVEVRVTDAPLAVDWVNERLVYRRREGRSNPPLESELSDGE